MQIDEAGARGHPAAFHHQVKRSQAIAEGCHQGQNGQLGLQHPLLLPAQPREAQLAQNRAFAEGQPEAACKADQHLGDHEAHQQVQGRQAQHGEAQVKAGERVSLAKGNRQQTGEPQAPAPGAGGGRSGQGGRKADAQGRVRPAQEAGE